MNAAFARLLVVGMLAIAGGSCSGGGSSSGAVVEAVPPQTFLTVADVERVITQALAEAQARGVGAQVAVVDRVGNVLALYGKGAVPSAVMITSGHETTGGIETRLPGIPSDLAAIAKAVTGAYLSSNGNAFSTRTAGQIIQEHFDPQESQQPSGPLFGVQFSQLQCSDVNRNLSHGDVGPKPSPLGLSPDPGGLPLYKNGVLVGGIGVELDRFYRLDRVITDNDADVEESIAVAGASGYAAPANIRADRITADGRTFRFVDSDALASDPARAPTIAALGAFSIPVTGYTSDMPRAGVPFGAPQSGLRPDTGAFAARGAWVLVDAAGANRFPPSDSSDLSAAEVEAFLGEALGIANRSRAQIRRPLGSTAQVTISVVDTRGDILGVVRTPDAPVFGIDVSVQKARGAMFFSHPDAAAELGSVPPAQYVGPGAFSGIGAYVARTRAFLGDPNTFAGNIAWSMRAIGNIHRPMFPDGVEGTPEGPLSKPLADWSPFNVGLQLDLVNNQLLNGVVLRDFSEGCAGRKSFSMPPDTPNEGLRKIRNGVQIFPGGVPIYRGNRLVGAIGVSGDGVDQDDMIAFLGLVNAGRRLGTGIGNAPAAMRADRLMPHGSRLRYVQCPQAPFVDSSEQNVCAGL